MNFVSTNHQVRAQDYIVGYSRCIRTLPVNSIQWAPHEWGLLLACGSSDESISFISTSGNIHYTTDICTHTLDVLNHTGDGTWKYSKIDKAHTVRIDV